MCCEAAAQGHRVVGRDVDRIFKLASGTRWEAVRRPIIPRVQSAPLVGGCPKQVFGHLLAGAPQLKAMGERSDVAYFRREVLRAP